MSGTENTGEPKYPKVRVRLSRTDGNAFMVIARVACALRDQGKVSEEEISVFRKEAMSGDYDNVLVTCMRWVSVS